MADWEVVSQAPVGGEWEVASQEPLKRSYAEDVQALAADPLGVAWNDVKRIPDDIVEGVKAIPGTVVQLARNARDEINAPRTLPASATLDDIIPKQENLEAGARMIADPARPVSSALNLLTLGKGGAVTVGRAALKAGSFGAKVADAAGRLPVSLLSGLGFHDQGRLFKAGVEGGSSARAVRAHMRGMADEKQAADAAIDAFKQKKAAQNADYLAGRTNWGDPNLYLDTAPIKQSVNDARGEFSFGGLADNGSITNALNQAEGIIDKRLTHPVPANSPVPAAQQPVTMQALVQAIQNAGGPAQTVLHGPAGPFPSPHYTPIGLDKLKQELDTLAYDRSVAPEGTKARAAISQVSGAVRDELRKNVPAYAEEMELASHGIQRLNELKNTLSLGEKARTDTTLAKLQSSGRNDVLGRFGFRRKLVKDLTKYQPDLPYMLAGQAASSVLPRGITGRVAEAGNLLHTAGGLGAAGALTGLLSPGFLIPLAASSPRFVGELRYGAGTAVRGARKAGITQKNLGKLSEAGRINSLFYPNNEDDEQ